MISRLTWLFVFVLILHSAYARAQNYHIDAAPTETAASSVTRTPQECSNAYAEIALFLSRTPLPPAHHNDVSARPVLSRHYKNSQGAPVPIPKGMSDSDFASLGQLIASSPAFEGSEAVVLFGSRTHHHSSYELKLDSDLDVLPFFTHTTLAEMTAKKELAQKELQPLS